MENSEGPERTFGTALGERLVCQYSHMVDSKGFWLRGNPFDYTTPVLLAQIALIFVVNWSTYFLLRPLRQTMIIAQIVAGIIMGPSLLARSKAYGDIIFPPGCRLILSTFAELGFMIHLFVLGVQVDTSLLKRIGRKATVIGITGFMVALAFGGSAIKIVQLITSSKQELGPGILILVAMNSVTSFIVTTSLLNELNILNSKIGRLASSTSMVSDACGWFTSCILTYIVRAMESTVFKPISTIIMVIGYYCTLIFLLRPMVIWIVSQTPAGRPIKESHFVAILCIVLVNGLIAEFVGQHAGFGSFLFGLFLPGGPQLGALLSQKLGTICSGWLLPIYCTISGFRTNISSLKRSSAGIEIIILAGYIGKFAGTILPSMYFEISFQDSLSLALIMCCRGVIDLAIYSLWKDSKLVDRQTFTLLIISMVIVTGFATPIVRYLYDPSKRYMGQTRITMSNSKQHQGLRILVCIHNEDNVVPIINLLEASNATKENYISVSVLQLMELTGRAAAVLIRHKQPNNSASKLACSEHIVNAFNQYERYSHGRVAVQHFTAIAPYASMHDDICTLALDEKTNIIIVPFHKKWAMDGTVEACFPFIRIINRHVIQKAPCSVGVIVDRSQIRGGRSVLNVKSSYRIAMLFLGGADDGEALEYSIRMARHPDISLTVVWFKPEDRHTYCSKKNPDSTQVMNDLRARTIGKEKITRKEVKVKDGADTTHAIRMMEDAFDLVIVGGHHEPECPATLGLTEWNECPELGLLGDMLASSDFQFSVLVVQQQYQED